MISIPGRFCVAICGATIALASAASAGDWPMWRYDAGHTAASPDGLPGELQYQWTRKYPPREPVWDDPLNRDVMPYDTIFEPVVASGRMFLSFNDSDKVVALDVRDGAPLWAFYADGPVRFSPVVYQDTVLFCSDDGSLYCVAAADGSLRWRVRGGPSERKVIGNRRVISSWPARGGPVVADDTVYFAASIWPFMGTFVYALDAGTGEVQWVNENTSDQYQKQPHSAPSFAGVAPQGQLAVAGPLLMVPGGRSLPAALDRATGKLKFFNFGGKGQGGSFVAADATRAFVHTRRRGTMALDLPGGSDAKFALNEPVLDGEMFYTASGGGLSESPESTGKIQAYGSDKRLLWSIEADGSGDLIKAGSRLYAAGAQGLTAIDLPSGGGPGQVVWTQNVEGPIVRLLAAAERLFAVTLDGRILAFGPGPAEGSGPDSPLPQPPSPESSAAQARGGLSDEATQWAAQVLSVTGKTEGYALCFGPDDAERLEALAAASELHIVAVDPDPRKVDRMRRQLDARGWYGRRIAVHAGEPESFHAPPYVADLVLVGRSLAPAMSDPDRLACVYESLRPYGGALWIDAGGDTSWADRGAPAGLTNARLVVRAGEVLVTREGALPGAGQWTHAYGDVANTVKSNDQRVKLPLGLLWFGGNSNEDVLPRHGHGPCEQVLGGRLFIQGVKSLSARDVYTGRVLWQREFEGLDTFGIYYDESYAETPLSTAYNQNHIPGANARGTNFVAAEEGVYLVLGSRCLLLDAAGGQTLREFVLPPGDDGQTPEWGYIGVYGDLLLAGKGFANYTQRLDYKFKVEGKRGPAWRPDHSASLGLLAFHRHTGEIVWQADAQHSFLHNAIVAGGGRIYLLDKLPKRVEDQLRRRGSDLPSTYRLLALDAASGETLWSTNQDVFGTWLSYSQEHDRLLQTGAPAADRSPDESSRGMAVHQGHDGSLVWINRDLAHVGPCMLHGPNLITNANSYRESKGAFRLLDGSPVTVADPVTGESGPWKFMRSYGCNTAIASEHMLTFRSGAAAFYDLDNHGGTGNFGGFRSGCSSNLIIADGVLNAPDYTRTCSCAYQNQTSLALIPMPENEMWTHRVVDLLKPPPEVRRVGINFGAPGDRMADNGTLWINHPADAGGSPQVGVDVAGDLRWFRTHSTRVASGDPAWVAASGVEGVQIVRIQVAPSLEQARQTAIRVASANDDAEESADGQVDLGSSDLELTEESSVQTIGIRFAQIPFSRGTKIKAAYVQFHAEDAHDKAASFQIRGQAVDDAPAFSDKKSNISDRENTQSEVNWKPKAWTAKAGAGVDQRTCDLSALVQEILDRPGWKSGAALALIIRGSGKRIATSFDGNARRAPQLVLEPEQPANAPRPPASLVARPYEIRLHLLEPRGDAQAGERVFDVSVQGQPAISGLDVAAEAGGGLRGIVRSLSNVAAKDWIEIQLKSHSGLPPVLSGIEILGQEHGSAAE